MLFRAFRAFSEVISHLTLLEVYQNKLLQTGTFKYVFYCAVSQKKMQIHLAESKLLRNCLLLYGLLGNWDCNC